MTRRPDDRGVSEVVGFTIVFTLIVLLLSVVQVAGVPAWNEQVEYGHSQQVQNDLVGLDSAVSATAGLGASRTTAVDLGPRYPTRGLFLNPPPAAGRLSARPTGTVQIRNVSARGNAGEFWRSASSGSLPTRSLVYRPDYNAYEGATVTGYEHGVVYNKYDDRVLTASDSSLVDGTHISLVTLTGRLNESGVDSHPVTLRPASAPAKTLVVTGSDGPVTLRLPTALPESTWRNLLDKEPRVQSVAVSGGTLTVRLDPEATYTLRLARVSLGGEQASTDPAYVVPVGSTSVAAGEQFTVEVRDRYDNPVPGAVVTPRVEQGSCPGLPETVRTDAAGQVTLSCDAPAQVSLAIGDQSWEQSTFSVGRPQHTDFTAPTVENPTPVTAETETYAVGAGSTRTLSQVTVEYDVADAGGAGLDRVALTLVNAGTGETVTATVRTFEGAAAGSGQWVTPWLALPDPPENYAVEVRVVDRAGNVHTCRVPTGGTTCA